MPRENPLTRDFHNFRIITFIIIIIFLSKPALSLPEQASALISSPNVSTVDGGAHGHRAFVFLSPYIPMADRGALPRLTLNDAIYVCVHVFIKYKWNRNGRRRKGVNTSKKKQTNKTDKSKHKAGYGRHNENTETNMHKRRLRQPRLRLEQVVDNDVSRLLRSVSITR